ncbi:MAG: fibronectin type III-like domain-contianing protein [Bacteroidales bacterium]|nr:fibronectin type III-like domain-contianing protein [Bacteroidales bacterium]
MLKGFVKVGLRRGESRIVLFSIPYDKLALWNTSMEKVVEPGEFEVMVGSSSEDIRLRDTFTVK